MRVVSNSTPLIALSRIGKLDILHILFGSIIIPEAVFHEVVTEGASRPGANEVQNATWIDVQRVENAVAVAVLASDLDRGESEAIVLAKEVGADYLLVDEKKARRIAKWSGIKVIGTAAILGIAAKKKLLNLDVAFEELARNGFRFSDAVRSRVKADWCSGK